MIFWKRIDYGSMWTCTASRTYARCGDSNSWYLHLFDAGIVESHDNVLIDGYAVVRVQFRWWNYLLYRKPCPTGNSSWSTSVSCKYTEVVEYKPQSIKQVYETDVLNACYGNRISYKHLLFLVERNGVLAGKARQMKVYSNAQMLIDINALLLAASCVWRQLPTTGRKSTSVTDIRNRYKIWSNTCTFCIWRYVCL